MGVVVSFIWSGRALRGGAMQIKPVPQGAVGKQRAGAAAFRAGGRGGFGGPVEGFLGSHGAVRGLGQAVPAWGGSAGLGFPEDRGSVGNVHGEWRGCWTHGNDRSVKIGI